MKTKIQKIYKSREGSPISDEQAKRYGTRIDKLMEENGGKIRPKNLIDDARDESSPLHEYFDWDDSQAGEKWRTWQARALLGYIKVVVKYDHTQKESRAYFNVNVDTGEEDFNEEARAYVSIENVMSEPNYKKQLLAEAVREIEHWEMRYKECNELDKIFYAVEKTTKTLKKKKLI